jgi:hypothetical protein
VTEMCGMCCIDCSCWKSVTLLHSKELIKSPLTTLPSLELQHLASEIAKVLSHYNILPKTPTTLSTLL